MAIKKILIIEDDRFIGEMYVRSLRHENYEVDWVVDGHDGLVMSALCVPWGRSPGVARASRPWVWVKFLPEKGSAQQRG